MGSAARVLTASHSDQRLYSRKCSVRFSTGAGERGRELIAEASHSDLFCPSLKGAPRGIPYGAHSTIGCQPAAVKQNIVQPAQHLQRHSQLVVEHAIPNQTFAQLWPNKRPLRNQAHVPEHEEGCAGQ